MQKDELCNIALNEDFYSAKVTKIIDNITKILQKVNQ